MLKCNLSMFYTYKGFVTKILNVAKKKSNIVKWSQMFARMASFGLGIRQTSLQNSYFWYLLRKISLQDSDAQTSHFIKNLRPHYNSFFPALFYAQVVSSLELQIFDTMKSCDLGCLHHV